MITCGLGRAVTLVVIMPGSLVVGSDGVAETTTQGRKG